MFCDFCPCEGCREGTAWLRHALTEDGRWICDVCYEYEVCISAFRAQGVRRGPCGDRGDDLPCTHRPILVGEWSPG